MNLQTAEQNKGNLGLRNSKINVLQFIIHPPFRKSDYEYYPNFKVLLIIFRMPNDKYFESGSDFKSWLWARGSFLKKYWFFSVLSHKKLAY